MRRASLRALLPAGSFALLALLPGAAPVPRPISVSLRAAADRAAPLAVAFEARVPPGTTVSWDFGDGATALGPTPSHTFYRPGTYTVRVRTRLGEASSAGSLALEVKSLGPERARVTLLHAGREVAFSAEGSRVYAPPAPRWTLDGAAAPIPRATLPDGFHTLRLALPSGSGAELSTEVRFKTGLVENRADYDLEVWRLTNEARRDGWDCARQRPGGKPLAPLRRDPVLDRAALAQSAGMALGAYFDHTSPVDGSVPADRARAAGYVFRSVGENIAGGQPTPREVVDEWLRSPGHCHNIMGDYQDLGVAFVRRPGSRLGTYWAQVFGAR